jgi:hypothetical protein
MDLVLCVSGGDLGSLPEDDRGSREPPASPDDVIVRPGEAAFTTLDPSEVGAPEAARRN